jgi:hypothetical protein
LSERFEVNGRNMRTIVSGAVIVLLLAGIADAQDAAPVLNSALLVGGGYEAPTRITGDVGLQWWRGGDNPSESRGFLVVGGIGKSGVKISAGAYGRDEWAGIDMRGVVIRTWADPLWATSNSTYAGAEVGVTMLWLRFSVGVLRRIGGPEPHRPALKCGIEWQYPIPLPRHKTSGL